MTKQPSYRFVGFEDEWKEVKLGEILVERNEQISESEEYQLMSFVQGKGVVPKSDRYDRSFLVKDDKKNYKKTEFGDFIYSSNNLDTGSIGFNKTGKALISPVYSIFYSKTKKESQFIAILSQRKEFINEMIKYRQGVVYGQFRIHESDFLNISILAPKSNEQEALINFFQDIDQFISLQQRKLEVLKEQKKTYLKLLFPAKGQTKPALRFAGFEDEWKEVKLGEVFDIVTDYVANGSFESLRNNVKTYEKDNFAYMIRLQDASNSWKGPWLYTDEKGYNFLSKSRLFKDDILMSNVGTVGRFFQVPELDRPMTLAPNSVLIRSTSSNNQFLYFMMLTANIQDQIAMRKTPGVQDKINKTDFKKVIATLPALSEQEAIGSFFQDLDKAIAKQEEKVNQLKESKQTLLRKMFI